LRIQNAVESYAIYVWNALWPTNLAAFYPHPLESIGAGRLLAAALFVGGVSAIVMRTAAKRPYALVGWFWYLGTLIPVIGLVQVGMQARADRYMYLPLIGLSIAISWGAAELAEHRRVPRAALAATAGAILVALGIGAWQQTATWRSTRVLYAHALSVTEDNFLAHKGFGNALLLDGDFGDAAYHFGEAARIAPEWPDARLGLADVDMARGRVDTALRAYERELERDPDNINAVGRYGIALGVKGRYVEARPLLERAVAVRSGIVELHLSLSIVEAELGRPRESLRYAREALRIDPNLVEATNGLAWTLATCADPGVRDATQAIREIERIALESGNPGYLDTLAAAYAAAGRFDDAVATAQRAAEGMEQMGRPTDASAFRARLSLYRQGTPYVDSRGGR
jgi:tetratricopeptide (TPR) repeat protein